MLLCVKHSLTRRCPTFINLRATKTLKLVSKDVSRSMLASFGKQWLSHASQTLISLHRYLAWAYQLVEESQTVKSGSIVDQWIGCCCWSCKDVVDGAWSLRRPLTFVEICPKVFIRSTYKHHRSCPGFSLQRKYSQYQQWFQPAFEPKKLTKNCQQWTGFASDGHLCCLDLKRR